MPLPPQAADWMNRAEIDYIGPFVKAWAAFNAWFRDASREGQERAMLNWLKSQPNAVRRGILPLMREENDTAPLYRPLKSCSCYRGEKVAMSETVTEDIKRWTAKRKSALVIEIIQ